MSIIIIYSSASKSKVPFVGVAYIPQNCPVEKLLVEAVILRTLTGLPLTVSWVKAILVGVAVDASVNRNNLKPPTLSTEPVAATLIGGNP
tara:strand:+ start:374 stop:643 length:270 start_codon:yes stop_codon:yes gene_type:complete